MTINSVPVKIDFSTITPDSNNCIGVDQLSEENPNVTQAQLRALDLADGHDDGFIDKNTLEILDRLDGTDDDKFEISPEAFTDALTKLANLSTAGFNLHEADIDKMVEILKTPASTAGTDRVDNRL